MHILTYDMTILKPNYGISWLAGMQLRGLGLALLGANTWCVGHQRCSAHHRPCASWISAAPLGWNGPRGNITVTVVAGPKKKANIPGVLWFTNRPRNLVGSNFSKFGCPGYHSFSTASQHRNVEIHGVSARMWSTNGGNAKSVFVYWNVKRSMICSPNRFWCRPKYAPFLSIRVSTWRIAGILNQLRNLLAGPINFINQYQPFELVIF